MNALALTNRDKSLVRLIRNEKQTHFPKTCTVKYRICPPKASGSCDRLFVTTPYSQVQVVFKIKILNTYTPEHKIKSEIQTKPISLLKKD